MTESSESGGSCVKLAEAAASGLSIAGACSACGVGAGTSGGLTLSSPGILVVSEKFASRNGVGSDSGVVVRSGLVSVWGFRTAGELVDAVIWGVGIVTGAGVGVEDATVGCSGDFGGVFGSDGGPSCEGSCAPAAWECGDDGGEDEEEQKESDPVHGAFRSENVRRDEYVIGASASRAAD
jgi:hypothetical protein